MLIQLYNSVNSSQVMLIQSTSVLKLGENYFTIYTTLGHNQTHGAPGARGRCGQAEWHGEDEVDDGGGEVTGVGPRTVTGVRSLARARGQWWMRDRRSGPKDDDGGEVTDVGPRTVAEARSLARGRGEAEGHRHGPEDSSRLHGLREDLIQHEMVVVK
jgi:hypothetical protein